MSWRWIVMLMLLAGCGGGDPEWTPVATPQTYVRDPVQAEEAALAAQRDLSASLLNGLRARDTGAIEAAFSSDLRARFPAPSEGLIVPDGTFDLVTFGRGQGAPLDRSELAARLLTHLEGWSSLARLEFELDRFWLSGDDATGRFELRLAGETEGGGRVDLRMTCLAQLERRGGTWRLAVVDAVEGTRLSGPAPRFVEVTGEVGLHYGICDENLAMLQQFADRHQTLALGGLSVVDWDKDGFWDLLATRRGQMALLFRNDGLGGFVPEPLPMASPRECGSFLLLVDLEGDGPRELIGSEPLSFEGDRARCGIWRETTAGWQLDARALEFPNPVGLRRLSIQTVVPCDVQGDGRLDLFFAVYGTAHSRGEDYNTVEAHDGADNHLFLQGPNGEFSEESNQRGISGSQYTYVAKAFDFDADGDVDLFEGNDFGPNLLWLNDGAGQFHADDSLGFGGVPAYTMGVTLGDFDGSGRWSLYLSNMSSEPGGRIVPTAPGLNERMRAVVGTIAMGNQLYTQDPASGRWEERARDLRVNEGEWAWGCVFWDPDGDGDQDLFVTNGFTSHSDPSAPDWESWYWRQVVADAGFLQRGGGRFDVNADAYQPSSFNGYERDKAFHQADGSAERFFESAWLMGLDADHDGRCAAPVDVDGDGDLDLALWTLQGLRLFENRGAPRSFLRLDLRASASHPSALGAVAEVTTGGRTQRALVRLTEGFQTQVPRDLHFGLGAAAAVERVVVRWPSGAVETWRDLPVDQRVSLVEGEADFTAAPLPAWPDTSRPLATAKPELDHFLGRAGGGTGTLGAPGRVTVVRLQDSGAPWPDLAALRAQHPDVAWTLVLPADAPAPAGQSALWADDSLLQTLFGTRAPTWPATFVFDQRGVARRSFRREVDSAELSALLATLDEEPPFPELLVMSGRLALEEGRQRLALQRFSQALELDDQRADACEGLGRAYMMSERPDLAEPAYARAVAIDPDYALGHYNLGVARLQLGRPAEAVEPLQHSLRVSGDRGPALNSLAEAAYLARNSDVALDAWARAAVLNEDDPEPRLNRAKLLGQLMRLEEAQAEFERVLALRPEHPEARAGLKRVEALLEQRGK